MENKDIYEISQVFSSVDDPSEIYRFLADILTPSEFDGISKRWALLKLLDKGMSQRAIAAELGLGLCKITRGSKELQKQDSIVRIFINKNKEMNNGKR